MILRDSLVEATSHVYFPARPAHCFSTKVAFFSSNPYESIGSSHLGMVFRVTETIRSPRRSYPLRLQHQSSFLHRSGPSAADPSGPPTRWSPDDQQPIPVCGFLKQARRLQVSGDIILAKRPLQAKITLPSWRGTWRQGRGSQPSHLGIYNETTDISVVKRPTRPRRKPFRRWVFVVGLAIVRKRIRGAGCDDARLPVFISPRQTATSGGLSQCGIET